MTSVPLLVPSCTLPARVSGALLPTLNVAVPVIVVAPVIVMPLPVTPPLRLRVRFKGLAPVDAIDNEGNWYAALKDVDRLIVEFCVTFRALL